MNVMNRYHSGAVRFRTMYLPNQPLVKVTYAFRRVSETEMRVAWFVTDRIEIEDILAEGGVAMLARFRRNVRAMLREQIEAGEGEVIPIFRVVNVTTPGEAMTSQERKARRERLCA